MPGGCEGGENATKRKGAGTEAVEEKDRITVRRTVLDGEDVEGGGAGCVRLDELAAGVVETEVVRERQEPGMVARRGRVREEKGEEGDKDGEVSPESERRGGGQATGAGLQGSRGGVRA